MKKYDEVDAVATENTNSEVASKPTLKQIATVLDCPMERIRSVAKKPIAGQAYDPKAINWDALNAFITNRLEKTGYDSLEDVYAAALEVEIVERAHAGAGKKMLDVEGSTTTPERKIAVNVGDTIVNKKTGAKFTVAYTDETIVVYKPISNEGKLTLSAAIGNRNFNGKFGLDDGSFDAPAEADADAE